MLRKLFEYLCASLMLGIALMALLGAVDPAISAQSNADEPSPYLIDSNVIPKIICAPWMGSGVYIGNGLVATARHVTSSGNCYAAGHPATIVKSSLAPGRDFVLLKVEGRAQFRALIDCGGFHEGQLYLATGYAEDARATVTQLLTGSSTRTREKGFAGLVILRGSVTQGMSGGPIVRLDNGALVGIINANAGDGITSVLSLPLSDTPLCKKD